MQPLNILLITADQWRGDCLSSLGHPAARTPMLDRFAGEATQLVRHFAQATPCGPSRASLYTGQYAFNHRSITNGTPLDARHTNLALELGQAGYEPVLLGYTDTSVDPRTVAPDDPRLRTYEGVLPGFTPHTLLLESALPWLDHLARHGYGRLSLEEAYSTPLGAPARWRAEHSETAFLADRFASWLDGQKQHRPWCAHLSFIKPHPPFVAAAPWHEAIDLAAIPAPARAADPEAEAAAHPWLALELARPLGKRLPDGATMWPHHLDAAAVATLRRVYLGLIAEVDHHIGRCLELVRARGDWDRTLIVVTSDHGELLGDHWMLGKSGFFPQAFHVPLLIRDPLDATGWGKRITEFTEHVDIMPTVLERAGRPVPLQCNGRSLSGSLTGEKSPLARAAVHYEHDFRDLRATPAGVRLGLEEERCGLAARLDGRTLYVHFSGLPPLCYDLEADPACLHDRSGDPAYGPVMSAAARGMLDWRMIHADRRLSDARLTAEGIVGRYDPAPPSAVRT